MNNKFFFKIIKKLKNNFSIGLEELRNLETLILDYNEIKKIKMENFHSNNNIKLLFIENNRLNNLNFVKILTKLKVFLVANNKIEV